MSNTAERLLPLLDNKDELERLRWFLSNNRQLLAYEKVVTDICAWVAENINDLNRLENLKAILPDGMHFGGNWLRMGPDDTNAWLGLVIDQGLLPTHYHLFPQNPDDIFVFTTTIRAVLERLTIQSFVATKETLQICQKYWGILTEFHFDSFILDANSLLYLFSCTTVMKAESQFFHEAVMRLVHELVLGGSYEHLSRPDQIHRSRQLQILIEERAKCILMYDNMLQWHRFTKSLINPFLLDSHALRVGCESESPTLLEHVMTTCRPNMQYLEGFDKELSNLPCWRRAFDLIISSMQLEEWVQCWMAYFGQTVSNCYKMLRVLNEDKNVDWFFSRIPEKPLPHFLMILYQKEGMSPFLRRVLLSDTLRKRITPYMRISLASILKQLEKENELHTMLQNLMI